eukprot:Hpha_TRINITY_DN16651_c0_g7::TRINITY_DN16651_c0_g7_i1::g.179287::m.179287
MPDFSHHLINLSSPSVDLSGLQVSGDVCAALCEALENNQSVVDVDLSGSSIREAGAAMIAGMLGKNRVLRYLNLARADLGDEAIVQVARGLRMNSTLQVLVLSANPFGDRGAEALSGALAHNSGLQELVMLDCGITHRGAVRLAAGVVENQTLLYMSLPFTIGYRLNDQIQRLLRRNWREHHQVAKRVRDIRRVAVAETERAERCERAWRGDGDGLVAPMLHAGLSTVPSSAVDWGNRTTGATMMYLHLLERKKEEADQRRSQRQEEFHDRFPSVAPPRRVPAAPLRPTPPPRQLGGSKRPLLLRSSG